MVAIRKRTGFAERLKAARLLAGYISATAFARLLRIETETYATYERGTREPRLEHLRRIADALSVTLDQLIPRQKKSLRSVPLTKGSSAPRQSKVVDIKQD